MNKYARDLEFFKSSISVEKAVNATENIVSWLADCKKSTNVKIRKTSFNKLKFWKFDDERGSLVHESKKFFSIDGIHVETNRKNINLWEQPIINQPEIGYLGIITKKINGVLHFLMQAKIEPGNINNVQISPTLQATRSNYMQVHKGKKPRYLEFFQNAKPSQILLDQLQSEQGARFLKKRNRNIIIFIEEDIPIHENFIWMTLAQIKGLLHYDNLVNMDTRTVISGISFGSYNPELINFFNFIGLNENRINKSLLLSSLSSEGALHTLDYIISFITYLKSYYDLNIYKIPVSSIKDWVVANDEIYHKDQKFFKVIAVDVEIDSREVIHWSQPMIEPAQEGLIAFICKEINGILHFIVQAKLECGNHDVIELAPTVQCLTGNYRDTREGALPFLDYVLSSPKRRIIFDSLQSEEGGRFYKEQNRNIILIAGEDLPIELPDNYIWMTLNQLQTFLKFNNYLNIQARSLIASISFI